MHLFYASECFVASANIRIYKVYKIEPFRIASIHWTLLPNSQLTQAAEPEVGLASSYSLLAGLSANSAMQFNQCRYSASHCPSSVYRATRVRPASNQLSVVAVSVRLHNCSLLLCRQRYMDK